MRARICDRCGNVYPIPDNIRKEDSMGYLMIVCNKGLKIGEYCPDYDRNGIDICPTCTKDFIKWLTEKDKVICDD